MAVIKLTQLDGLYPGVLPRNLAPTAAQTSENLLARTNEFRPLLTDTTVATIGTSDPKSLFRLARKSDGSFNADMSTGWRMNANEVNYVKAQIDDSTTERTYYTFGDGSAPPRALDATGADRLLGVPAPTVKPAVTLVPKYTFTEELKQIESDQALQQAIQMVFDSATLALVGLAEALPIEGWLPQTDFSTEPEADRKVMRVFALNPSTKAVIDTYSDMLVTDTAWLFNPALGGYYGTAPVGYTLPAWATGHSLWWVITMRGFARAYDINTVSLKAAFKTINLPGTEGAQKLLTDGEAQILADRVALAFDKDEPEVKSLIDALKAKQSDAANAFNSAGMVALNRAVTDFYSRADVASSIASAKAAFAETIWRYAEMIGTATAAPFYQDPTN